MAASTARFDPTLSAVDESSSAASVSSIWSVAAISAKPKSIIQGRPSVARNTLARRKVAVGDPMGPHDLDLTPDAAQARRR